MKTCSRCGAEKAENQFYRRASGAPRAECKTCTAERSERDRLRRLSGELPVVVPKTKRCNRCGTTKPAIEFHRHAAKPDGLHVTCKVCRLADNRKSKYGIDPARVAELEKEQDGLCAICLEPTTRWHVDHCHVAGVVRGLLCGRCNTGIGQFKDDPARLTRAIAYLQR